MEYKTLENTDLHLIHQAFLEAFSDYDVPMALSFEDFESKMKCNGLALDASLGAFEEGKLVAFVLNGVRMWKGRRTIYDSGTAVIPAYRHTGITSQMFEYLSSVCAHKQIEVYLLEVIQDNDSAVRLYTKQSFKVSREFICYKRTDKNFDTEIPFPENSHLERVDHLNEARGNLIRTFWNDCPSWQNSIDAVMASEDAYMYTLAKKGDHIVGYGVIDKKSGSIPQLAVDPKYRRHKIGTAILQDLAGQTEGCGLRAVNINADDPATNAFMKAIGFTCFVRQYEMEKEL